MRRCYGCMKEYSEKYEICPYCGYVADTVPEVKSHLLPGIKLSGRFVVGKALGHGGFGITYIAWDEKIKKVVAVKEYFPNAFSTRSMGETQVSCFNKKGEAFLRDGVKKMLEEAERLSKFSKNENIVDISDYFEENNTAYIVMEYLEGKDLKKYLEENGDKLAPEKAVEIILPVLNALEDMHKENLIHRDISPDNIFLCDNGKVKLLDFGSARLAVEDSDKSLSVMVKRGYAPKEQYASRSKQGPWTDVYAVCATLYRMITGKTPVESTEREDEPLKSFSEYGVKGYEDLEKVIFKGLEVDYTNRTRSVSQLREMLKNPEEAAPETVVNSTGDSQKRKFNFKAIIAAVAAVAVVAAGVAFGVKFMTNKLDKGAETTKSAEVKLNEGEARAIYEEFLSSEDLKNANPTVNAFIKKDISLLSQEKKDELETLGINSLDSSAVKKEYHDFDNDGVEELLLSLDIDGKGSRMNIYLFDIGADKKVFEGASRGYIAPVEKYNHIMVLQDKNDEFYFVDFTDDGNNSRSFAKSVYDGGKLVPVYSLIIPDCQLRGSSAPDFAYCDVRGKSLYSTMGQAELAKPEESEITSVTYEEAYEHMKNLFAGTKITGFCDDSWDNWEMIEVSESGELNSEITWKLYESGYLMIEGTGRMPEYELDSDHGNICPWEESANKIFVVSMSEGITHINKSAFSNSENIEKVFFSDSLISIGDFAFAGCSKISDVIIPDNVTNIGEGAFRDCGFVNLTIPGKVTNIGDASFEGCEKLKSVIFTNGINAVGNHMFSYCENLETITFAESIRSIGEYAFCDCNSLKSITIPDGVTSIGLSAFGRCQMLTSISVGNGNRFYSSDKNGVLFDKDKNELIQYPAGNLTASYVIPDGVIFIGDGAFSVCNNLTDITIPDSVTYIGRQAMQWCENLENITIPDGVTVLGNSAFEGCNNLESVIIPGSVEYIENYAFSGCESLESVTIQDGVKNIGACAFSFCTSLTSITIPASVTYIDNSAFSECALADVHYQGSQTQWRAIDIESYNDELTGAKIHYKNSAFGFFD